MSLLNLNALGVTLGDVLFSDLDFSLNKGDRVGLVAANGRGKSTLMGCIVGEIEPFAGEIGADALTLYDYVLAQLPAETAEYESWRVDVALDDLSVPYEIQHRVLGELSGGWQRTGMLAGAWIGEPDVLLLDEPTNHLDLHRIALLQDWLARLPRGVAVLVPSHDRAFLDAVTTRTVFLRAANSRDFALPFSAARAALDTADAAVGINSGSDLLVNKTKQLTERADRLEAEARPAYFEKSAGEIRLANSGTHAKALVSFADVSVEAPDGTALYRSGEKWIERGDRIVLLGANGTGKTRLIKAVAAALVGQDSAIKVAPSVVPAYSDQHLSQLVLDQTPMQAVTQSSNIGDQRARGVLAGAGVDMRMQDTAIRALSGGQKARLAMLLLRLAHPNFYLLDEPTNHLDIEGQEALEEELVKQGAACLLVSHDRSFLRNVGNRFWMIERKRLVEVDSPEPFLNAQMQGAET